LIWDTQVLELADSRIGSFSICCKLKSLEDSFEWGLIGVYWPNDDYMRSVLFEGLSSFMYYWDICWCLGGDFNVIRFPPERSIGGCLSFPMRDFSNLIDSWFFFLFVVS